MMADMAPRHDGSALLSAAHWLEGLVHSPVTTALAVIAIAATGLAMLNGRLPVRRGLTVALGCFILFGAPAIARGIVGSASAVVGADTESSPSPQQVPAFSPPPPPAPPPVADPYAGASVR